MAAVSLLDAALKLAAGGRPVFPCVPRGKRPLTEHGLLDATADRGTIEQWWARWPDANVAIRAGQGSRLVVLDVDGELGAESLHDLEHQHGRLPRTASVKTPRGGQHFYFRHPGVEVRNSAGVLAAGLDIRGDGGYVLAPPSVGRNGRWYEPDELAPVAKMPAWLRERTVESPGGGKAPASASEWIRIVRDGLPDGTRNHGLARLTGHLLRRYVDVDLTAELVQLVNRRCQPPLPAVAVDRIVDSIASREARRRQRQRRA